MSRIALLLVLIAFVVTIEAQLTFTSNWGTGKRSAPMGINENQGRGGPDCTKNFDAVVNILKMIQVISLQ